jgi:dihydropteroate synthase
MGGEKTMLWQCRDRTIEFVPNSCLIMGILNVTPDSFYDGGQFFKEKDAIARIDQLIAEGADIIDIGAESTRPASMPITAEEELQRIIPVLKYLSSLNLKDILISVDTYKAKVLKKLVEYPIHIANNIYALRKYEQDNFVNDEEYARIVKQESLALVLMHMQGTPTTMQNNPLYKNVVKEIIDFLKERIEYAKEIGIDQERLCIDPGIGFGKLVSHNIEILQNLSKFCELLKRPILIGLSRKSFIGKILDIENPKGRLYGSLGGNIMAFLHGACILRVHDVKETKQCLEVVQAILKYSPNLQIE